MAGNAYAANFITRADPRYSGAGLQFNGQGDQVNPYDSYLAMGPGLTESYWRNLGYTGPVSTQATNSADAAMHPELQRWMAERGYQIGTDGGQGWNALMDAQGNYVPGSEYANRSNDDATFIAGAIGLGAAGYAGGMFGGAGAATPAGTTATGTAGTTAAGTTAAGTTAGTTGTIAGGSGLQIGAGTQAATGFGTVAGTTAAGTGGSVLGGAAATTMPAWVGPAISTVGGLASQYQQGKAAQNAAAIQAQAAKEGQATQLAMFEAMQKGLSPYVTAGNDAMAQQRALAGLDGPQKQQEAIAAIQGGPQFTAMQQLGENRIRANASASGGLRGGNFQSAMAQFSPQLLSSLIEQQYGRLGGLTQIGQASAAGVGSAGITTGQGVSNLQQQAGAAQAGGALAQGRVNAGYWGTIANGLGMYAGLSGGW